MDTYAVALYFDFDSSSRLKKEIENISALTKNNYMVDLQIPPHITIGLFYSEGVDSLIEICEKFIKRIETFNVRFSGVGTFGYRVIYASPIKDKYLEHLNIMAHEMFEEYFQPADDENYIPSNWIPHCALAVRIDEEQFKKVKMEEIELPAIVEVQKVALVRCNPYKEIKVWEIKKP